MRFSECRCAGYDDRFTYMSLALIIHPHKTSRFVPRGARSVAVWFGLNRAFDAAMFEPLGAHALVLAQP